MCTALNALQTRWAKTKNPTAHIAGDEEYPEKRRGRKRKKKNINGNQPLWEGRTPCRRHRIKPHDTKQVNHRAAEVPVRRFTVLLNHNRRVHVGRKTLRTHESSPTALLRIIRGSFKTLWTQQSCSKTLLNTVEKFSSITVLGQNYFKFHFQVSTFVYC